MTQEKCAPNGPYTRLPNVTFELFDIFNLLDSERCFFMWFFKEYHHRSQYVGSLRDLTKLTGRSKSNVDRIIKHLGETGLLKVSTEGKQTIIEVDELALWAWNKVSSTGHNVPSEGQRVPWAGQGVPHVGQQGHINKPEKPVHEVGINSNKDINKTNKEGTNAPSLDHSSISSADKETTHFTAEEDILLSWLDSSGVGRNKDANVVKGQLQELVPVISSIEMLHKEIEFVRGRINGNDPTVYLGNLVGNNLKAWLQTQQQQPMPEEQPQAKPATSEAQDLPAVSPGRRRGMLQGIANGLATRIMADMPDAVVEVRSWNGVLYRVCLTVSGEEFEFAKGWEYDNWRGQRLQVAV